jgi:large subunit ribosomal protein L31
MTRKKKDAPLVFCGRESSLYLPPRRKRNQTMKQGIHPENYRVVVFKDMTNEFMFLGKSAAETKETVKWEDGNDYPVVKLEISAKSHPFYTGKVQFVDTAGRIDKFKNKYAKFQKK